jgi:hypothetical protein
MSHAPQLANERPEPQQHSAWPRLFAATLGRFDEPEARETLDALARWVERTYHTELARRPSKHVYIDTLPAAIGAMIDRVRDSAVIHDAILQRCPPGWSITPMKHTDELYISHYNKDYGGDHGLFAKHYDGNLRFIPFGAVVRALIYVQSDDAYTVVFGDSGVRRAFTTYEFGLLDFHRELHWVEGEYRPGGAQRILLKCNYLVAPRDSKIARRAVQAANTAVFYVVKAAMEYSKSPETPAQRAIGLLCNLMRLLNNVHPLVPLLLVAATLGALAWGVYLAIVG